MLRTEGLTTWIQNIGYKNYPGDDAAYPVYLREFTPFVTAVWKYDATDAQCSEMVNTLLASLQKIEVQNDAEIVPSFNTLLEAATALSAAIRNLIP